jgi:DnaJ-domain-containing protein 1
MARVVQAVRHSGKAPEVALAVDGVALVGPGRDTLLEPTQNSEAQAVLLGQLHQGKLMLHGLQREQD